MFQYSGSMSYNASAKTFIHVSSWREKVWFAQQFIRRSVEMMLSHEYGGIYRFMVQSTLYTSWNPFHARNGLYRKQDQFLFNY